MKTFDLNILDLTPLENIVQKHLSLNTPIKFEKNIKEKNGKQYIEFETTNIVVLTGIFKWILKECVIGSFAGGAVYDDGNGEYIWFNLNLFYKHEDGGTNGMKICDCWYYINEDNWRVEFVGSDYCYKTKRK